MIPTQAQQDYTIITIDNDASVVKSLDSTLASLGYASKSYPSVKSFLDALSDTISNNDKICILLDLQLWEKSGVSIQTQLKQFDLSFPIIFISGHADVITVVNALQNGAFSFLSKPIDPAILLDTLAKAIKHHQNYLADQQKNSSLRSRFAKLSEKERAILQLILEGKINRDIAKQLSISIKTVEYHRNNIRQKLNVKSSAELIKLSLQYQQTIDPVSTQ